MKPTLALLLVSLTTPLAAQGTRTHWTYTENRDAFTNADRSYVSVDGPDGAFIVVRCSGEPPGYETFVSMGEYLGSNDSVAVRWKVDQGRVHEESQSWFGSTTGRAVFYHGDGAFFKELKVGRTLLFEATDVQSIPHQATFRIDGFAEAFRRLPCSKPPAPLPERRQRWLTCYLQAAFATEIAACSRQWLTTHRDSAWAETQYSGLQAAYLRSDSIRADSIRRMRKP